MEPLRAIFDIQGFFTRDQARQVGYDDRSVAAAVRSRMWQRIRRGYYVYADAVSGFDVVERHLLTCRCVLHSMGSDVALSHVSGALAHGLSVWNCDLSQVHVTRLDGGAGRVEAGVVHHEGLCLDEEVVEVDGMRVLQVERCAVETGSLAGAEGALVTFDSLLCQGLATHDDLARRFRLMSTWPRMRHLHVPVRMATELSQSAGESRGRWLFWTFGLPAPQCQFEVRDASGILRGTCDWGWPCCGLLGEFDGVIKYGRLVAPGLHAGDVVFAEKKREDELRELTGYAMIRLTWDDYSRPSLTASRVRRLLRGAA
jgi:hypothetical protein